MSTAPTALRQRPARLAFGAQLPAWIAFAAAFAFCAHYYFDLKKGFFDDVYIYLAIARNALDYGTWQYYPGPIEREALLASSPARIFVLAIAAAISKLLGYGDRSLYDAKVTLLISGLVTWAVFAPFWRNRMGAYAWIGAALSFLAVAMDTIFEFEGGLLLLWMATLAMLITDHQKNLRAIGWLLPIGPLIRPDLTLPILILIVIHLAAQQGRLLPQIKAMIIPVGVLATTWIVLCALLDVWPIPVTYWGKSAIPFLFENESMLSKLAERLGASLLLDFGLSPTGFAVAGWTCIVATLIGLGLTRPRISWLAIAAMALVYALLFSRMPANFAWYYQNLLSLVFGLVLGRAFATTPWTPQRIIAAASAAVLLGGIALGRVPNDGPGQWRTASQSRAQGYLSLAIASTERGTFYLPEIGEFILRNPEIGMISYYSKKPIFQWDSAGLAQPVDDPKVANSSMRHFYPKSLRRLAQADAQQIVDQVGRPLPVLSVWAMEDRNYDAARKACRWVIPHRALCINQDMILTPSRED
ncbi:hypothetical protein [Pseudoxanthomonas suwonensis]|uniref:hypothetical protein n=1 Tax=Pseudoxanthomonas suwonensis TaxID=314722 RepID=UPI0004917B93|nr:hypothetical protein [Pseudoxanthomonas suwonensis]